MGIEDKFSQPDKFFVRRRGPGPRLSALSRLHSLLMDQPNDRFGSSACRLRMLLFFWVAMFLGLGTRVQASCWSSNTTGSRTCGYFKSPTGNLKIKLCEDVAGDCAKLGYTSVADSSSEDQQKLGQHPASKDFFAGAASTKMSDRPTPPEVPPLAPDRGSASDSEPNVGPLPASSFGNDFAVLAAIGIMAFGIGWISKTLRS